MSERIHALAYQLFGKTSIDECDLDEVRHLAMQHPYFAPAQFLLLQKLKQTHSEEYTAQLQKAVLYYHNPLEFEYFVNNDRFYTEVSFDKKEEVIVEEQINETSEVVENVTQPVVEEPTSFEQSTIEEVSPEETSVPEHQEADIISQEPPSQEDPQPVEVSNLTSQTPNAETELTFEPYHTVDYFASQGIKLSQEEVSKDNFGKQLKSFTEWLRSMKRLPAPDAQKPETVMEQKVQHMAEGSIHQSDVVTEAMAEVWLKQGNTQKAIETYNKLSLLNPSKKAYFAAKIDNLKSS